MGVSNPKKSKTKQQKHWANTLDSYDHLSDGGDDPRRLEEESCGVGSQSSEKGLHPANADTSALGAGPQISKEGPCQTSFMTPRSRHEVDSGDAEEAGSWNHM